jgi:predicted RNA-binding protein with PUA-like domain
MALWLIKSEPETYSFDDLVRDKKTSWDGVRNYTARNNLKAMKKGDLCLVYHSVGPKEIVGIAEVTKEAYPDPTLPASDPEAKKGWVSVEVKAKQKLKRPFTLAEVKAHATLKNMQLVKQSRLSVAPVTQGEWDEILSLTSR